MQHTYVTASISLDRISARYGLLCVLQSQSSSMLLWCFLLSLPLPLSVFCCSEGLLNLMMLPMLPMIVVAMPVQDPEF